MSSQRLRTPLPFAFLIILAAVSAITFGNANIASAANGWTTSTITTQNNNGDTTQITLGNSTSEQSPGSSVPNTTDPSDGGTFGFYWSPNITGYAGTFRLYIECHTGTTGTDYTWQFLSSGEFNGDRYLNRTAGCANQLTWTGGYWLQYQGVNDPQSNPMHNTYKNAKSHPAVAAKPNITNGNCVLQDVQLVGIARFAGVPENQLATSVAIAIAESGSRVNALHLNSNGSYDIGLWQINDVLNPSYDRDILGNNPTYNAGAMKDIYSATGTWSKWNTFTSGAYTKYISRAANAVSSSGGASFGLVNCQGGQANADDKDGDGVADNPPSDDNSNCGFSFNPLNYLKCLFIPSDGAISGWKMRVDSLSEKPPISIIKYSYNSIKNFFSPPPSTSHSLNLSVDGFGGGIAVPQNVVLPGNNTVAFSPLQEAADTADRFPFLQAVFKMGIILGAILAMWSRIGSSFGEKKGVSE